MESGDVESRTRVFDRNAKYIKKKGWCSELQDICAGARTSNEEE